MDNLTPQKSGVDFSQLLTFEDVHFLVTRTRANVLYQTRANIDEYWTRANVFISDQGQRF